MKVQQRLATFLGRHDFDVHGPNVQTITDILLAEMEGGLARGQCEQGQNTTCFDAVLDMTPTYMKAPSSAPLNKKVIVIDAGGTNFRSCLVSFNEQGQTLITHLQKRKMPASDKECSKEEFFQTIAEHLDNVKDMASTIGFCFSYSMRITSDGDGEVLQFSKEIKAPEVVGSLVGENLAHALKKRGWTSLKKIVLLNDTVAALLAGAMHSIGGKQYDSFIGFILGTGMNVAYIEEGPIAKISQDLQKEPQIVVCESGKANKIPRSDFDREFVKTTNLPDSYWYEKMCAGGYIGALSSLIVRTAGKEGLFSPALSEKLAKIEDFSLIDLDSFLHAPYSTNHLFGKILTDAPDSDRELLYHLFDAIVRRSAVLAAAMISACVLKSGRGKNPLKPVCVLAEGTTFLKTHSLKAYTKHLLYKFLTKKQGRHVELLTLDHAVTIGSAVAGLLKEDS